MTDDQRTEGRTDNWPQHKLTWSKAPGELMTKLTKSDKNKFKNHIQTMCTSTDLGENVLSFKDQYKIVREIAIRRYSLSIHLRSVNAKFKNYKKK